MVSNTAWVFAGKAFYVVLWTFILNLICSYGYRNISWFLVLFPFILFFILIGLFMLNQGVFMLRDSSLYSGLREGLEGMDDKPAAAAKPAAAKPAAAKPADNKAADKPAPKPAATKPADNKTPFSNRLSPASF
jgi:hypothetical protein